MLEKITLQYLFFLQYWNIREKMTWQKLCLEMINVELLGWFLMFLLMFYQRLVEWSLKMKTVQLFLLFIAAEKSCVTTYLQWFAILDIARPAVPTLRCWMLKRYIVQPYYNRIKGAQIKWREDRRRRGGNKQQQRDEGGVCLVEMRHEGSVLSSIESICLNIFLQQCVCGMNDMNVASYITFTVSNLHVCASFVSLRETLWFHLTNLLAVSGLLKSVAEGSGVYYISNEWLNYYHHGRL